MYRPILEYYDLPTKYDETVVRLLVQSPTRMYVYWEVGNRSIKNFDDKNINYNECTPYLKIINLTMNYSYEIKIDPFATNYYIDVKDVNCDYKVELGRRNNNEFIGIYQSNKVIIPRSMPAVVNESEEIIYRNYIKMEQTDKFTVYRNNINNKQSYYDLALGTDDNISSISRYDK